jgi:hypothetical protein
MPDDVMVASENQDDMANFLDLDFDFSAMENIVDQSSRALPSSSSYVPTTTMMQDVQLTSMDHHQIEPHQTTAIFHAPAPAPNHTQSVDMQGTTTIVQPHMKHQFYPQSHHQPVVAQHYGQQQPSYIPPTPTSMELHPRANPYAMRVDTEPHHRAYEPYMRSADDQVCSLWPFWATYSLPWVR